MYFGEKIEDKYLILILGFYNFTVEINYEKIQKSIVLKINNVAAMNIIIKDKSEINLENEQKAK